MFQIKSQHFYNRYLKFIQYCRNFVPNGYTEIHHIMPKSMGGSNNSSNLILLTARQHFIAHHLLWKSYRNKETNFAFWSMRMKNNMGLLNSKTYSKLKEEHSSYQSKLKKIKNPMFGKSAIKEKNLKWYTNGVQNKFIPENTQEEGWQRGRTIKTF